MTVRARAVAAIAVLVAASLVGAVASNPAFAAGERVAIIVGPSGGVSNIYRSMANEVASAATAAGANVVKVYSPNATWANVRAAVAGAKIIVYFGHGNGFPNPYGSTELTDRTNGWGLNRTTTNGDSDNWTSTLAYCGEKALLGTLTASDGAVQWNYCGGKTNTDGISPAPGFVMVYAQAHYAPGFGERYQTSDPLPTLNEAQQRVRNYSYPVLARGASGYFATAYGDADRIVSTLLSQPTTSYADIFRAGDGYSASALRTMAHPDVPGAQVWVQATRAGASMHFNDPDYWYAYAGDPNRAFGGSSVPRPVIVKRYPSVNATNAPASPVVSATFDMAVTGVSGTSFTLRTSADAAVPAAVTYNSYWKRAELRPSQPLNPGWTYVASLTSAVRGTAGGALTPTTWSFRTASVPNADDADYSPAQRLSFRRGTHTGYRFDAAGRVIASRTMTLANNSGASTSMRRVLPGQSGRWYYVVNGGWAGYWVRESSGLYLETASVSLALPDANYSPTVGLTFRVGTHTGYRFDSTGAMLGAKTATLGANSGAHTSMRRSFAAQTGPWYYVTNGIWAGHWVRASDVIYLP